MLKLGNSSRYSPTSQKIGILHPLEGPQRQFFPRGYQVNMGMDGQDWGAITEVDGVLLPYEVRPKAHPNVRGEKPLLIVPYEDKICYAVGPLTVGETVSGWRQKKVTADFFIPADHLTPYPFDDKQTEGQIRPFLEHPLLVRNVVIDLKYENPWEYSYELCA